MVKCNTSSQHASKTQNKKHAHAHTHTHAHTHARTHTSAHHAWGRHPSCRSSWGWRREEGSHDRGQPCGEPWGRGQGQSLQGGKEREGESVSMSL